jgi:hypothetical protein
VGYYGSDGKTQSSTSSLAGAVVLIAIRRPGLSTPYAAPLALPHKQVERPPDARGSSSPIISSRWAASSRSMWTGTTCRPSFWRARSNVEGSQHEHARTIEEAKIGAFELPAERAEAGEAAGAEPARLGARAWPYANDLGS